ncbi:MAG: type II toxin-antitoxin system VapC family toxin [Actinomycetales bacterium]|nr:type II toxin-antitoxin system VapC family toxin [Actinomycetales bacterium]
MSALYLDSSALCKLVAQEPESPAIHSLVVSHDGDLVASDLARTEVLRMAGRLDPPRRAEARAVLDALVLVPLLTRITDAAGVIGPPELRSLDALHLATALELGDDLAGIVTYDQRQADAARQLGLTVISP